MNSSSMDVSCLQMEAIGSQWSDFHNSVAIATSRTGAVFRAQSKKDGRFYILKRRVAPETGTPGDIVREARILRRARHPNIVHCFGYFWDYRERAYFIVLEYVAGGDLAAHLQAMKERGRLPSSRQIVEWLLGLSNALVHLHALGIVHRDIKALNIFVSPDGTSCKLGDFGVGRELEQPGEMLRTLQGTPLYLAPEICNGRQYNYKVDIWSLGIVAYEMCTLRLPFDRASLRDLYDAIASAEVPRLLPPRPESLESLIRLMLSRDVAKRPDALETNSFLVKIQVSLHKSVTSGKASSSTEGGHTADTRQDDIDRSGDCDLGLSALPGAAWVRHRQKPYIQRSTNDSSYRSASNLSQCAADKQECRQNGQDNTRNRTGIQPQCSAREAARHQQIRAGAVANVHTTCGSLSKGDGTHVCRTKEICSNGPSLLWATRVGEPMGGPVEATSKRDQRWLEGLQRRAQHGGEERCCSPQHETDTPSDGLARASINEDKEQETAEGAPQIVFEPRQGSRARQRSRAHHVEAVARGELGVRDYSWLRFTSTQSYTSSSKSMFENSS